MATKKFIFVTGGVLSGVGKGITAASIGAVLQAKGVSVSVQKCDPYLNVDAGLLNPREHGECFVTKDGAETDLDLGHYERFLDLELTRKNSTLSGRLLRDLINDERAGKFGGQTVQLVPHLTNAIKQAIHQAAEGEVHLVEIGGTVGDYESLSFIEAIREFAQEVGRQNCLFVHVVYVPFLEASHEYKTKPAQNALADLRGFGIMPDVVGVRTEGHDVPPRSVGEKIATFSGVRPEGIVMMPNVSTVYEVPLTVARDLGALLSEFVGNDTAPELSKWRELAARDTATHQRSITVGLVAKYIDNSDTYLSVTEALKAAAWAEDADLTIRWLNAETVTDDELAAVDAVVVPGGFGERGVEGKIAAATYCLQYNKPYLGICLGLQVAVIAAARLGGVNEASSEEFGAGPGANVIYLMDGQDGKQSTGGTWRLGDYPAVLQAGSLAAQVYDATEVVERHRHRYEVNQAHAAAIERGGLRLSGTSPDGSLVEFVEAPGNDYFIATQAHPEFRSRPFRAHPLFRGLILKFPLKSQHPDTAEEPL
ncbi:MAG: CTP synthase [Candidatus Saccharibacteria bacterium]|nr:CTP synthase [Candidatus Saccharibacteria bacterium]